MNIGDADKPFLMTIEEVFSIKGRGTVIAGRVESGTAVQGDEIEIGFPEIGKPPIKTTIIGFEGFIKDRENFYAMPGDNVGVLLREISVDQIKVGMVTAEPGSVAF